MSNYATVAELRTAVGYSGNASDPGAYDQLTDLVTAATADDAVAQTTLDGAEGIVDSYVGRRYLVPVTAASAIVLLKRLTLNLAVFQLWSDNSRVGDEIPARVKKLADQSIEILTRISDGDSVLPSATVLAESGVTGPSAYGSCADRVMDPTYLERF